MKKNKETKKKRRTRRRMVQIHAKTNDLVPILTDVILLRIGDGVYPSTQPLDRGAFKDQ